MKASPAGRARVEIYSRAARFLHWLTVALIAAERQAAGPRHINWILIAVAGAMAIGSELAPRTWVSTRSGTVTLLPAFAYALILLGSPSTALAIAVLASTVSLSSGGSHWRRAFGVGRTADPSRRAKAADESRKEVAKGDMPPGIYLLMHPDAKLSEAEKQQLIAGLLASLK